MIIEIKDLPKDRNVKKVTFDIEFEDSEVKEIIKVKDDFKWETNKIDTSKTTGVESSPYIGGPMTDSSAVYTGDMPSFKQPTTPKGPNIRGEEQREKKEIPSEMTDMEF